MPRPARTAGNAAALAGVYKCMTPTWSNNTVMYMPATLGTFEIHGDGSYSSASFPGKGTGTVAAGEGTVEFTGGAFAGWSARTGQNSTGSFIHLGSGPALPPTTVKFGESICFRQ